MEAIGIILAILLLGLMIFVHELGHYLVARWVGMEVRAFSIGFGKAIWSRTVNGVEYRLGILPFGGYVMLPEMYAGMMEGLSDEKHVEPAPPLKRIVVALAGGVFNIIFALILAVVVSVVGIAPVPEEHDAIVGYVGEGSEAEEKGIRLGDEILAIQEIGGGKSRKVDNFAEFFERNLFSKDGVIVSFRSPGEERRDVVLKTEYIDRAGVYIVPGLAGRGIVRVGHVVPDSPAGRGGVLSEDIVTHVDGEELLSFNHMVTMIQARTNTATALSVEREVDGVPTQVALTVTPTVSVAQNQEGNYLVVDGEPDAGVRIGIWRHTISRDYRVKDHPPIVKQITKAAGHVTMVLKRMMTPRSAGQAFSAISGPVGMFEVLRYELRHGFMPAIALVILISVNLAIVNLLPLPVLDGGHIIFAFYRLIVGRNPNPKFMLAITNVFVLMLIGLMIFVSFRDVTRFWVPEKADPNAPKVEWLSEESMLEKGYLPLEPES